MTKDIIVDVALAVLSEYGLGDLIIRRLTRHLGTTADATHWHCPSKQALLGTVADRILAPRTEFPATGDWRADIEVIAELFYSCLTAHRDGVEVVSAALATGTTTIRPGQPLANVPENIPETSTSTTSAADTVFALMYFILGTTVDQQTAIALNLNRVKDVSGKGDTSAENAADKDVKIEASSEDAAARAKELGR